VRGPEYVAQDGSIWSEDRFFESDYKLSSIEAERLGE
jgi:hypothetical protein